MEQGGAGEAAAPEAQWDEDELADRVHRGDGSATAQPPSDQASGTCQAAKLRLTSAYPNPSRLARTASTSSRPRKRYSSADPITRMVPRARPSSPWARMAKSPKSRLKSTSRTAA